MNIWNKPWTPEEVSLFDSGMSIKEIAKLTGRSKHAVYAKKYYILEHGYEQPKEVIVRDTPLAFILTQSDKEQRLTALMNSMRVRLG